MNEDRCKRLYLVRFHLEDDEEQAQAILWLDVKVTVTFGGQGG